MLHLHFCRLMKDRKRFFAVKSIPIISTTSSKIQNSVVPLLFSMNYYFVCRLDGLDKGYHTGTIRQYLQIQQCYLNYWPLKSVIFSLMTTVSTYASVNSMQF